MKSVSVRKKQDITKGTMAEKTEIVRVRGVGVQKEVR